ncbi:GAF domain-containing sensor histidine kinase [Salinimicrobium sp. GXAS 041]|uniref:GAF domain-containing sensor histidine kinase n=1 Tax=Salinimicrobium sp. GXAS 041 TaxID=3400806 RepID=UPI003C748CFF
MAENNIVLEKSFAADVENINKIPIVPQLLDVICSTTGMGFAAIARVTEDRWITCTTKDNISFGLKPGDELKIETTMCQEVRQSRDPIFIDHVDEDEIYCNHPVPKMYGITSYVSFPIIRRDGTFFGTLCAIDNKPARVKTVEINSTFKLFAELISFHLQSLEEIAIANAKLEEEKQLTETREQFIAVLGHDLRNPLATMKMSADILQKFSKEEIAQKQAKTIKSTAFRMQGLIDNLLDFARGRFGEGIILQAEKDNEALEDAFLQVLKEAQMLSPEVEFEVDFNLDEPVNCDSERMAQLLLNLLNNATTHGAMDTSVKVEATSNKEEFRLSVTNSGTKIPEEAQKHLFQPFYRDEVRPGKQGLGLGLYITAEIARAHDAKMHVDSTEDYTTFTFIMPHQEN